MPATKALPKEMLSIVDKPMVQFIVEEAKASSIEDILIITGKNNRAIENHFDSNPELEQDLQKTGKSELLKLTEGITDLGVNLYYTSGWLRRCSLSCTQFRWKRTIRDYAGR